MFSVTHINPFYNAVVLVLEWCWLLWLGGANRTVPSLLDPLSCHNQCGLTGLDPLVLLFINGSVLTVGHPYKTVIYQRNRGTLPSPRDIIPWYIGPLVARDTGPIPWYIGPLVARDTGPIPWYIGPLVAQDTLLSGPILSSWSGVQGESPDI